MAIRRVSPRKRTRVIDDSEDEDISLRDASPPKRSKGSPDSRERKSRILTPTTSEDDEEGISYRGPWTRSSHISVPPMTRPKSSYIDHSQPLDEAKEYEVLKELLKSWHQHKTAPEHESSPHIEFVATNFSVYKQQSKRYFGRDGPPTVEEQLCSLETLRAKRRINTLYLDAKLSCHGTARHVRRLPFELVSIEGYDDVKLHSITGIFLQTKLGKQHGIWLRLGKSSAEYKRYHTDFLWVADFGKHAVDYMMAQERVTLEHFRNRFYDWVVKHHGSSDRFKCWISDLHSTDFRVAFNRYFQWIWHEATNEWIDEDRRIRQHPIWSEADPDPNYLTAISHHPSTVSKTVVTSYVYKCFQKMYFGSQLQLEEISDAAVRAAWKARKEALGFARGSMAGTFNAAGAGSPSKDVRVGDVVGVQRDVETQWTSKAAVWYFYINRVEHDYEGAYYLGVWLYEPQDTTMSTMSYLCGNELFFSDNCNCGEVLIRREHIISTVQVAWSPKKLPHSQFFVRQTFVCEDQTFRSFKESDLLCNCQKPATDGLEEVRHKYALHDTILYVTNSSKDEGILEPGIIEAFLPEEQKVRIRRLLRAKRDTGCGDARPHELVWTSKFVDIRPQRIVRSCNIRFLPLDAQKKKSSRSDVFNRDGQADCFLISKTLIEEHGKDVAVDLLYEHDKKINRSNGFELDDSKKLYALSLFCGGGNFDRGVEEAGAVQTKWAVEWNKTAAHTYRANIKSIDETAIFMGSVDDHLHQALAGMLSATVPAIGQVQVLLAGSPCQGFSAMQQNRMSVGSLTNASKVATVASYIDLWRPLYAVLENVPEMTRQVGEKKKENVFSQLLCCLVGMGYQVQQMLMDAWSYGEAQSRPRLFIVATAPGMPIIEHPNMTHAHPEDMPGKSLGKAPNGLPFGVRFSEAVTYPFVSSREATKDLPDIGDGHTLGCLSYPDHRLGTSIWPLEQEMIRHVPKRPRGQGLTDAYAEFHKLPKRLVRWIERQSDLRLSHGSKSWRRIEPFKLFKTITTKLAPSDGIAGWGLHWDQDRVLTIMEARRAQGFLDHEVVLGDINAQWKIIGNSVSRAVALALGMSLRQAWLAAPAQPPAHPQSPRHASPRVVIGRSLTRAERFTSQPSDPIVFQEETRTRVRLPPKTESSVPLTIESRTFQQTKIKQSSSKDSTEFRDTKPSMGHPSLNGRPFAIRRSQTPSPQGPFKLPKTKTTTIIELDDDGNVIHENAIPSGSATPGTPGFTIHRDHETAGASRRSLSWDDHSNVSQQRYNIMQSDTEMRSLPSPLHHRTMQASKGWRKAENDDEGDGNDDDEVVFVRSQTILKC